MRIKVDTVVAAIITMFGNTIAIIVGLAITNRYAKNAAIAASDAKIATAKAATDAYNAQISAANAAKELMRAARQTEIAARKADAKLAEIKATSEATHIIVNSGRNEMLGLVADLWQRISSLLPADKDVMLSAQQARKEADIAKL